VIVASFVFSILSAISASDRQGAPSAVVSPKALFESYARGEYGKVEDALKGVESPRAFIRAIKRDAEQWTRLPDDPETAERRRLIVATVALEAAYRPPPPPTPTFDGSGRLRVIGPNEDLHDLIEWACALVRHSRLPTPGERLWHWLAIALMEGDARYEPLEIHVRHALDRFPAEPRFILARAIAGELRTSPDERGRSPRDRDRYATDTLVARLDAAEAIDSVRPEASLRHAYLLLRLGQPEAALSRLGDPEATKDDPFLIYLAWLFRGRALDALGRTDDAIAAYREAAVVVPHAQTAEMALAAALAKRGERSEAAAIALASLTSEAATVDPWRMYGSADARVWQKIRDALRMELRK
jgi:hypothetical protein